MTPAENDFVPVRHILHFLTSYGYFWATDCDFINSQLEGLKANESMEKTVTHHNQWNEWIRHIKVKLKKNNFGI